MKPYEIGATRDKNIRTVSDNLKDETKADIRLMNQSAKLETVKIGTQVLFFKIKCQKYLKQHLITMS